MEKRPFFFDLTTFPSGSSGFATHCTLFSPRLETIARDEDKSLKKDYVGLLQSVALLCPPRHSFPQPAPSFRARNWCTKKKNTEITFAGLFRVSYGHTDAGGREGATSETGTYSALHGGARCRTKCNVWTSGSLTAASACKPQRVTTWNLARAGKTGRSSTLGLRQGCLRATPLMAANEVVPCKIQVISSEGGREAPCKGESRNEIERERMAGKTKTTRWIQSYAHFSIAIARAGRNEGEKQPVSGKWEISFVTFSIFHVVNLAGSGHEPAGVCVEQLM